VQKLSGSFDSSSSRTRDSAFAQDDRVIKTLQTDKFQ
jgi:hypothetical protein